MHFILEISCVFVLLPLFCLSVLIGCPALIVLTCVLLPVVHLSPVLHAPVFAPVFSVSLCLSFGVGFRSILTGLLFGLFGFVHGFNSNNANFLLIKDILNLGPSTLNSYTHSCLHTASTMSD